MACFNYPTLNYLAIWPTSKCLTHFNVSKPNYNNFLVLLKCLFWIENGKLIYLLINVFVLVVLIMQVNDNMQWLDTKVFMNKEHVFNWKKHLFISGINSSIFKYIYILHSQQRITRYTKVYVLQYKKKHVYKKSKTLWTMNANQWLENNWKIEQIKYTWSTMH